MRKFLAVSCIGLLTSFLLVVFLSFFVQPDFLNDQFVFRISSGKYAEICIQPMSTKVLKNRINTTGALALFQGVGYYECAPELESVKINVKNDGSPAFNRFFLYADSREISVHKISFIRYGVVRYDLPLECFQNVFSMQKNIKNIQQNGNELKICMSDTTGEFSSMDESINSVLKFSGFCVNKKALLVIVCLFIGLGIGFLFLCRSKIKFNDRIVRKIGFYAFLVSFPLTLLKWLELGSFCPVRLCCFMAGLWCMLSFAGMFFYFLCRLSSFISRLPQNLDLGDACIYNEIKVFFTEFLIKKPWNFIIISITGILTYCFQCTSIVYVADACADFYCPHRPFFLLHQKRWGSTLGSISGLTDPLLPVFHYLIGVMILIIAALVFAFLFEKISKKALPNRAKLFFVLIFISYPLNYNYFIYPRGLINAGLNYLLIAFSFLLVIQYQNAKQNEKKNWNLILSAFCAAIAFSSYEIFAVVFVTVA